VSIGVVFAAVLFIFWIWAIFDSIQTPKDEVRNLPKLAWVAIVVLFASLGALAWVLLGRPKHAPGWGRPVTESRVRRPLRAQQEAPVRETVRPEITDRRSRELDLQLERWEREQRTERDVEGDAGTS
jgi:hypothetical protein